MLRLQSTADFERVRREGRSHAHPLVVLITHRNGRDETRCGFAAGKSVGGAVKRNRAKRLMREAVRVRYANLEPGWDLIFIARAPLAQAAWAQTQTAVDNLLKRANVLKTDG